MNHTTDVEIRAAFHKKRLHRDHICPNTMVIDELGLAHGKNRVDIAVLNGYLHGYEIKSSKDTLSRFPNQLKEYRKSLEKITIIAAPNHINELLDIIPEWCGVIQVQKGNRGAIHFSNIRHPNINPETDSVSLAHLLWRNEAVELLNLLGADPAILKYPKIKLYQHLSNLISIRELSNWIKEQFLKRDNWRVAQPLFQDDDLQQLVSK